MPLTPEQLKTAAAEKESKSDVFYLLVAVLGTLFLISGLMVSFLSPIPLQN
jgi:hypothetical protein